MLVGNEIVKGLLGVVASPDVSIYDTHRIDQNLLNCKQYQLLDEPSILRCLQMVILSVTLHWVT